jgi:hypothetical protein
MNRKTLIQVSFALVLGVALLMSHLMWNKPFSDPLTGDAVKITAIRLFNDFSINEAAAQKEYATGKSGENKVEVTGVIKNIGKNDAGETYYILKTDDDMFGVKCIMQPGSEIANASVDDTITIRGFCDGFNMDVIVNRCKPVKE